MHNGTLAHPSQYDERPKQLSAALPAVCGGDTEGMSQVAAKRGADALIADLEDGFAPDRRAITRRTVSWWLDDLDGDTPEIWVRIDVESMDQDIAVAAHPRVHGLVVAKSDDAEQIAPLSTALRRLDSERGMKPNRILRDS